MEIIDIINRIIKDWFIYFYTYQVFIKIINYKHNDYRKMAGIFVVSLIEAIIGSVFVEFFGKIIVIISTYVVHGLITAKVTEKRLKYSIIVTFISLIIAYLSYILSIIISSLILKILIPTIQINNIAILFLAIVIEFLILNKVFKIKRFRNGIPFLKDAEKVNNIGIIGCAFIGIAVMIFSLANISRENQFRINLILGIIIEAICFTIWIRRKITKHYKQIVKKDAIQELEDEIAKRDAKISEILEENKRIATINHKYSSRITALEKVSTKLLANPEIIEKFKTEFGEDFAELQKQINKISEEFSNEMENKVNHKSNLIKTGIFGIDNLLEHMCDEAEKQNIKFDLKVNGSINYMVEKVINQSKLETLLGDHIKDAIIAIQHSNNTNKRILTIIGIIDNTYEVCIYDTGIEFEIETLLKLGKEQITTHKDTGGSGIGFMTTFENLKATKASLIIEENHPENSTDYTKAVRIRFDGKHEYKIKSYRAEEIKKEQKDNRVIIEKI